MKVRVRTILGLTQVLGKKEIDFDLPEGSTVRDLLTRMVERWGNELSPHLFELQSDHLLPYLRIMVNGQTIQFLNGMETVLKDDDELLFIPLAAGG